MNNIKAGDRVSSSGVYGQFYVVALDDDAAWVKGVSDPHRMTCSVKTLHRIEPEPGTLSLGQVVRRKRDAGRPGVVTGLEARIRWGDCLFENVPIELLEPVPSPCPTCGKE